MKERDEEVENSNLKRVDSFMCQLSELRPSVQILAYSMKISLILWSCINLWLKTITYSNKYSILYIQIWDNWFINNFK